MVVGGGGARGLKERKLGQTAAVTITATTIVRSGEMVETDGGTE